MPQIEGCRAVCLMQSRLPHSLLPVQLASQAQEQARPLPLLPVAAAVVGVDSVTAAAELRR